MAVLAAAVLRCMPTSVRATALACAAVDKIHAHMGTLP